MIVVKADQRVKYSDLNLNKSCFVFTIYIIYYLSIYLLHIKIVINVFTDYNVYIYTYN
jgi:hypothetical protein